MGVFALRVRQSCKRTAMAVGPRNLEKLTSEFAGEIVRPGDSGYDAARAVWNSMIDRRPALIVRPTGNDDVAAALRFAREQELIVAVRCGGHSIPGFSTCDDGIVIDLSRIRGAEVDPGRRHGPCAAAARCSPSSTTRRRRTGSSARWASSPTRVWPASTLGGGMGRLQRRFGLTIDSLRAVELVTADGQLVRASEDENPELFWGLRGAGANFGIVTSFEFRPTLLGAVTHGMVMHPIERADAGRALPRARGGGWR